MLYVTRKPYNSKQYDFFFFIFLKLRTFPLIIRNKQLSLIPNRRFFLNSSSNDRVVMSSPRDWASSDEDFATPPTLWPNRDDAPNAKRFAISSGPSATPCKLEVYNVTNNHNTNLIKEQKIYFLTNFPPTRAVGQVPTII